jgi:hypothetical protein
MIEGVVGVVVVVVEGFTGGIGMLDRKDWLFNPAMNSLFMTGGRVFEAKLAVDVAEIEVEAAIGPKDFNADALSVTLNDTSRAVVEP